jgi:uncharacterized OsmC-like protein
MLSKVIYLGELRTAATHLRSGTIVETDAPIDNQGRGERFSPSDMVATALASCMLTIMGIAARTHEINIVGTECDVEKIMVADPRRIGEIRITMNFTNDHSYSDKEKKILEHAAMTCPVIESLHPDIKKTVSFLWP